MQVLSANKIGATSALIHMLNKGSSGILSGKLTGKFVLPINVMGSLLH